MHCYTVCYTDWEVSSNMCGSCCLEMGYDMGYMQYLTIFTVLFNAYRQLGNHIMHCYIQSVIHSFPNRDVQDVVRYRLMHN